MKYIESVQRYAGEGLGFAHLCPNFAVWDWFCHSTACGKPFNAASPQARIALLMGEEPWGNEQTCQDHAQ